MKMYHKVFLIFDLYHMFDLFQNLLIYMSFFLQIVIKCFLV